MNRGMVRTILLDASPAPMITNLQINDGDIGRSQVTSLSVAFDSLVDHPALLDAFTLTHSESDTRVGQLSVTADDSTGKTIATIMFSGVSTVPRSGTGPRANSLADGNYQLVINANQIRSSTGTAMIGDYVWGQQAVDKLFRLFGDTDGGRDVDSQDYGQFGLSFLKPNTDPGYHAGLDFDGDGDVDGIDHARFKQNLFGHL